MKLTPEMEAVRAAVFPRLSPDEYWALLERNRAQFARLPAEEQRRLRVQQELDEWTFAMEVLGHREKLAGIRAKNAVEDARRSAKRAPGKE